MNLEQRREAFSDCTTMARAMEIVTEKKVGHREYSFYTSLDRVQQMLTGKMPNMWLTRINSGVFDDLIECKKYGSKEKQSKVFIKCFAYGFRESAAMWGLYCPTTYKAIRVTVTEKAIRSLLESQCFDISNGRPTRRKLRTKVDFSDLVYASVKTKEDDPERSTYLYWNGVRTKQMPDLHQKMDCRTVAGRLKDIEWSFENEARLIVSTSQSKKSKHVAIKLPHDFVNGMSFTLSPWADDSEEKLVRDKIVEWLKAAGRENVSPEDRKVFRTSVLKGALKKWAEQRGLA